MDGTEVLGSVVLTAPNLPPCDATQVMCVELIGGEFPRTHVNQ